jgi:heme/copper-type cytochrome/quinol oxidase subunit 4
MLDFSILKNPVSFESLDEFVVHLVNLAISFSVLIAIVALIIAGFKYILAMGDEEKVESATKSLIFAIVGLVIVFIAPLIVEYITNTLLTN